MKQYRISRDNESSDSDTLIESSRKKCPIKVNVRGIYTDICNAMLTLCPDSCLLDHGGVATEAGLSGTRRQQEAADGGTAGTRHQLNCDPASARHSVTPHYTATGPHTARVTRLITRVLLSQCPGHQHSSSSDLPLRCVQRSEMCLMTGDGWRRPGPRPPRVLASCSPSGEHMTRRRRPPANHGPERGAAARCRPMGARQRPCCGSTP